MEEKTKKNEVEAGQPIEQVSDRGVPGVKEMNLQSEKVVAIKYNGDSGWHVTHSEGSNTFGPGDTVKFDITDKQQLHQVLWCLKTINAGVPNQRVIVDKKDPNQRYKYAKRFEVVEGIELLPSVLKEIKFNTTGRYTNQEQEAIKQICPAFFEKEEVVMRVKTKR